MLISITQILEHDDDDTHANEKGFSDESRDEESGRTRQEEGTMRIPGVTKDGEATRLDDDEDERQKLPTQLVGVVVW